MLIMVGNPAGKGGKIAKSLGLGYMIACSGKKGGYALPTMSGAGAHDYYAMDNGAFSCYVNGEEFNSDRFNAFLNRVKFHKLRPLFIVCPDIVGGGLESLEFSMKWRDTIEYEYVALVVQDGMEIKDIEPVIDRFQYLFIGGTVQWKWDSASKWIDYAHEKCIPCHIGQAGQPWMIKKAYELGADSIDSTSWQVNLTYNYIIDHIKENGWINLESKRFFQAFKAKGPKQEYQPHLFDLQGVE